jgi:hypothetical protein
VHVKTTKGKIMTTLTHTLRNINQPEFATANFVNDSFWSLLLLASLMAATLIGIQQVL